MAAFGRLSPQRIGARGRFRVELRGSLIVASDDVWAGSGGGFVQGLGLWHYDGSNWVEMEPIAGARELVVQDMVRTEDGALWLWADFRFEDFVAIQQGPKRWSHALARFDGETWTTIREIDGVPLEASVDRGGQLELAPNGDLLFAISSWESSGGLFRLRDGQWARVVDGSVNAISVAPDGTVWLAGWDGLFRLPAS